MSLSSKDISEHYAGILQRIGDVVEAYAYQGRMPEALALLQGTESLLRFREVGEVERMGFLLKYAECVVDNYFFTNKAKQIMDVIVQQTYETALASGNERLIAAATLELGRMLYYTNLNKGASDFTEVRSTMRQALERYEEIADTHGMARSLFFIGLTYERHGDEEQARGYYRQALDIAREYDDKEVIAETTRHLAGLNLGKDNDTSLRHALESLRLREEIGMKRALPSAYLLVARVYAERAEMELAWENLQLAQTLAGEMKLESASMSALIVQGGIQQKQDRIDEARASFTEALEMASDLRIAYAIATAKASLANLD